MPEEKQVGMENAQLQLRLLTTKQDITVAEVYSFTVSNEASRKNQCNGPQFVGAANPPRQIA